MKVCYVDESGHCGEKYNREQPVEVLCGVVTDASKLFKTQKEHSNILDELQAQGISLKELKAAEIHKGRKEWGTVPPELRDHLVGALLTWGVNRVCKFVVCPIDSEQFFKRKSGGCQIASAVQFPWEAGALNVAMAIQREFDATKNNKGKTFVIFDEQQKHDDRFLRLFENDLAFTDGFTGYKLSKRTKSPPRFDQIVDIPHFSKSHLSVLIQLADLGAYVVNRHLLLQHYGFPEGYEGETGKVRQWYLHIAGSMVGHSSIDAPGNAPVCEFYRNLRPKGWTAKLMKAAANNVVDGMGVPILEEPPTGSGMAEPGMQRADLTEAAGE